MSEICNCQACKYGLWRADGERGVFARGEDKCQKCGALAMDHSRSPKRCKR